MKKKILIHTFSFLIATIIILLTATQVLATEPTEASGVSGINPSTSQIGSFKKAMEVTIGIAQIITVGFGVIMLVILAIKIFSSAPAGEAELKKHAVVYIVGAVLAFGASGIIEIFKQVALEINKDI